MNDPSPSAGTERVEPVLTETAGPSRGLRAALSFFAAFAGWVVGLAWQVVGPALDSRMRYRDDFEPIALWSGAFVLVIWLVAMMPLALRLESGSRWTGFPRAPILGAVCGWAGLFLLLAALGGSELAWKPVVAIHAALAGAFAWSTYAFLLSAHPFLPRRSLAIAACVLAPPIAIAAFHWIAWPALERAAPSVAYRCGSSSTRSRVFERTIRELRVGETLADLQERLPGEFTVPTTGAGGQIGAATRYWIRFEDGVITSVEIGERR